MSMRLGGIFSGMGQRPSFGKRFKVSGPQLSANLAGTALATGSLEGMNAVLSPIPWPMKVILGGLGLMHLTSSSYLYCEHLAGTHNANTGVGNPLTDVAEVSAEVSPVEETVLPEPDKPGPTDDV